MDEYRLCESEFRFATLVWDHEPVPSGNLVKLAAEKLGWKKSTTYTVLKKLCERGILQNEQSIVTAKVAREEVQRYESEQIVNRAFGGSLPRFIAAFMGDKTLTSEQVEELKKLIDRYQEGS